MAKARIVTVDVDGVAVNVTGPQLRELRRTARAGKLPMAEVDRRLGGQLGRRGWTVAVDPCGHGYAELTDAGRKVLAAAGGVRC